MSQADDLEAMTVEVMRVAQTAMKIVGERIPRADTAETAHKLVALLATLSQEEACAVIVVLAASHNAVIQACIEVMIKLTRSMTDEEPPEWINDAMGDALRKFVQKGLDPDVPRVRQMMHDIFQQQEREEQ